MFFNVKDVREYLLKHGIVYSLRKKRWRVGNDIAVKGSYSKRETIAKIFIEREMGFLIISYEPLTAYVGQSGLFQNVNGVKIDTARKWLRLAQKLSGNELYLYKITIRGELEL